MTDEALRRAARNASRMFVAALEADYDPQAAYPPSPAFRRKLRSLRRRAEHPYAHAALRRAAMFLLACLVSGGVWMARDAYAGVPRNWVRFETEDGTINYRFLGKPDGSAFPSYRLGWIPEGFELVDENDWSDLEWYNSYYENAETGEGFGFDCQFMNNIFVTGLSMDNMTYESTAVNGLPADYYETTEKDGTNNLFWFDQEHNLVFTIEGSLDRETMFQVAENVMLVETP